MKYKTLIVEDEMMSRQFLMTLVNEYCTELELTGTASNVAEAVQLIDKETPDIVFMDIEMQTGTGFDVLQQVRRRDFHVIFTTAFDHYAIKAIKFSAIDYLLKPVDLDELREAVDKAVFALKNKQQEAVLEMFLKNMQKTDKEETSIGLSTSEGIEYIKLSQIIRLEANGPYTTFFIRDRKKIMVSRNLKEYELLLNDHPFFRVHNSHIIHLNEIRKMVKTDGGYVVMSDDSMVAISPKKKEAFVKLMSKRLV
ncbi:LytTR family DNA-binding domain-containing protein [Niabella terrae]